jgi:hypothetical protein
MKLGILVLSALATVAMGSAANATDSATLVLHLHAEGAPFCRLYSPANDSAVDIVDGEAQLGPVREVCNLAGGYTVRADFTNLSGGSVASGAETATIDASGTVRFSYGEARAKTSNWALTHAQKVQAGEPVYLRLSISPI